MYGCFACMYVCALLVCLVPTEARRRLWDLLWLDCNCELLCGCQELSSSPPEEQQMLLTTELSLQPQKTNFKS